MVYVDTNECDSANGQCEQICTNTDGSYECSCRTTFFLNNDKHTCTGEYTTYYIVWKFMHAYLNALSDIKYTYIIITVCTSIKLKYIAL